MNVEILFGGFWVFWFDLNLAVVDGRVDSDDEDSLAKEKILSKIFIFRR